MTMMALPSVASQSAAHKQQTLPKQGLSWRTVYLNRGGVG
jgi:hypothetical protein